MLFSIINRFFTLYFPVMLYIHTGFRLYNVINNAKIQDFKLQTSNILLTKKCVTPQPYQDKRNQIIILRVFIAKTFLKLLIVVMILLFPIFIRGLVYSRVMYLIMQCLLQKRLPIVEIMKTMI